MISHNEMRDEQRQQVIPLKVSMFVAASEGKGFSSASFLALSSASRLASCSASILAFHASISAWFFSLSFPIAAIISAISRLAYALSLARHGRPTPLVSMHMPYSSGGIKSRAKWAKLNKAKRRASSRTKPDASV